MTIPEIKLSPADKKKLVDMAEDITALQREITKAETAGIDVKQLKDDLTASLKLRSGILRVYG